MTIYVLMLNGKPFKGSGWNAGGRVKAFDNEKSANISAGQWRGTGVTVQKFVVEQ